LAGHKGRNQITRELHEQGIKVSHGSISNIINAYKRKHEQPKPSPNGDDVAISTGVPMNIGAAGSPLLNRIGKATTNSNVNSNTESVTVKRNEGGPLSYFLPSDTDMDTTENVNTNSNRTSIITDKERYLDNSDMIQQHNEPIPDIDFSDNPYPDFDIYTDLNADYDERYDGIKGERRFNYQYTNTMNPYPNTTFPNTNILFPNNSNPYPNNFNQQVSRHVVEETKKEESDQTSTSKNMLGMDWDENHEARFVKWVMDQKSIRQKEERKLEEQWGLLVNERNSLEEQKRNLEAREAKLSEVKDLIPS
jgi:hypothetical protein